MADPITLFGAAAGALQLSDVVLRASREAYGLLTSVKDATKDIEALRNALRDMDDNVRSHRNYLVAFSRSKSAREEFEVLPEIMTRSLTNFHEDIDRLKSILPRKTSPGPADRVRWVYSKSEIKKITERLLSRKIDLNLALSTNESLQSLQQRQDLTNLHASFNVEINRISRQQQTSSTTLSGQVSALESQFRTQHVDHAQLSRRLQQTSRGIHAAEINLYQQQEQSRDTILAQLSSLTALIETNEMRNEATSRLVRSMFDSMTNKLIQVKSENMSSHDYREDDPRSKLMGVFAPAVQGRDEADALVSDVCLPSYNLALQNRTPPFMSFFWSRKSCFGSVQIESQRTNYILADLQQNSVHISIRVHFRPAQTLFPLPGISAYYDSAPNKHGFYHIAPMITTFPIIPGEHPVWHAVWVGDLRKMQEMFATGQAHPRCQDRDGSTLLHHAMYYCQPQIWTYLLSIGLSLYQRDNNGVTPLHHLLMLFGRIMGSSNQSSAINQFKQHHRQVSNLLKDHSNNLIDIFEHILGERPIRYRNLEREPYTMVDSDFIATVLEAFEDVLIRQAGNAWQLLMQQIALCYPTHRSLTILKMHLHKGLDPNFVSSRNGLPLLLRAMLRLRLWKVRLATERESGNKNYDAATKSGINGISDRCVVDKFTNADNKPVQDQGSAKVVGTQHNEVPLWCILTVLVKAGADIYYMQPDCFDCATHWRDIWTPLRYANDLDVLSEWEAALQECEIDPNEARRETEQRAANAMRLRGARRTGVDEADITLPSFTELRHRFHPRKAWYWAMDEEV